VIQLALESGVCSSFEPFELVRSSLAVPARESITLSPSILRLLQNLVKWLGAVVVLLVITTISAQTGLQRKFMVHYTTAAAAESYFCMRH
jgi:hypothetical protein